MIDFYYSLFLQSHTANLYLFAVYLPILFLIFIVRFLLDKHRNIKRINNLLITRDAWNAFYTLYNSDDDYAKKMIAHFLNAYPFYLKKKNAIDNNSESSN
jgi:hypothetical protein